MSDEMITVFMNGGEFVDRQAFIDMRNRWSVASEEIVKQKDRIEEMKDALLKAGMALVLSDTTNFPKSVKLDGKLWAEAKTAVDRILLEQGWIEED